MKKINTNKIGILAITLVFALMLSGCMYEKVEVSIDKSGSGEMYAIVGITEQGMNDLAMYLGGDTSELKLDELEYFVVDGKEYYGESQKINFSSIEDFNETFSYAGTDDIGQTPESSLDFGSMYIDKLSDNTWVLTVSSNAGGSYEQYGSDMKDMYEDYAKDIKQIVIFNMPGNITQVNGDNKGIKIEGTKLTINFHEFSTDSTAEKVFNIDLTNPVEPAKINEVIHFNDVKLNDWYYKAVMDAAQKGIIGGYGNHTFGPRDSLTVAQFSQIIYRQINGNNTTSSNDYWATDAIKYAISSGYIADRGEINSKNYDVVITREESVAGLARALKNITPIHDYKLSDIADAKNISEEYKDDIVRAFNIGITTGVDSNRTFLPKNGLTRAEFCQLMYNVVK